MHVVEDNDSLRPCSGKRIAGPHSWAAVAGSPLLVMLSMGCGHRAPTATIPIAFQEQFRDSYNIALSTESTDEVRYVTFDTLPKADQGVLDEYCVLLFRELGCYSAHYRNSLRLTQIVLCRNLQVNGSPVAAVPAPEKGMLICDVRLASYNATFEEWVIHHELFHYAMGILYGDMYWHDPVWEALNPPGWRYGAGGSEERSSAASQLTHPDPGFIDKYAESSEEEDMAELDACRYQQRCRLLVSGWSRSDAYLRSKTKRLKEIVQSLE